MSFTILQLGTVVTPDEISNNNTNTVIAQELSGSIPIGGSLNKPLVAASNNNKLAQNLQNLKTVNVTTVSAGSALPQNVKPVTVTYPVNKTVRDPQRITNPQTNTTQVLTTRVISQKLPPSTYQIHPTNLPVNTTAHTLHLPVVKSSLPPQAAVTNVSKIQSLPSPTVPQNVNTVNKTQATQDAAQNKQQSATTATITNLQTTMHQKLQVSAQQILSTSSVKTITTTSVPNFQRIQVKSQSIGGKTQTVNLQKVKTITNVNSQTGQQRGTVPRIQTVPKPQVLTPSTQTTQVSMSQVMNSANMQRVQQINSGNMQQHMQKVHQQPLTVNNAQKGGTQGFNNQPKVQSQISISNPQTHGMQKVQHSAIQQSQQQIPQKNPSTGQKTIGVQRQQQSNALNNFNKTVQNSVAGIQKLQTNTQQQQQQQQQQNVQTAQPQRQQNAAANTALQKSQTLANINSNKTQNASNITKSSSVPNISKLQQNQNLLNANKQQVNNQQQQITQLQQQLLHQNAQQSQVSQKQPQQQINVVSQSTQRCQTVTGMQQKMATITTVPNNQRNQVATGNSKAQQQQQQPQMVLRVGPAKNQSQNMQPANLKPVTQKMMNSVKPLNPQNAAQQSNRTVNSQPVKIIQQQQQNVIGPQNTQKQPGCIKTIPAQKPTQRNHLHKISGIKTSLNTNLSSLKGQGAQTNVPQKTSIKTLLPQQTSAVQNIVAHKIQSVKIQQQIIQQKQLVMTAQYPQQIRNQAGQIKTLLPVISTETRKDSGDNKIETESYATNEDVTQQTPQSPVRRMPLPYECLQFVLQDHNYGAPPPRTPPPASPPPHTKQQPINGGASSTTASQHPFIYSQAVDTTNVEDDAGSAISSEAGREAEPEGEETETAPEGEGDDEDSVTRCICDFEHDDGYMICCDRCLVWQHVDCMGIDRSNIPDEYLCEMCRPRRVDKQRARALQLRKREELLNSDTSSDSSSTSSADTDVGVNNAQKKRTPQQQQQQQQQQQPQQQQQHVSQQTQQQAQQQAQQQQIPQQQQQQQQQQPVPLPQQQQQQQQQQSQQTQQPAQRRKSDPPPQVRRLSTNNNNNNVAKRQRRDAHPRQTSAARKKETVKRGPGKRKTKRRMSLEDREEDTQDAWGTNMAPLRQWIERYEEAVTNHYSPELRARISSIKVNGAHGDLRQSNMNAAATGKCRLNVHSNNLRFLIATMYLPPNTPVVELRGKYMLSTQHRPSHPQGGRQHAQRPGPFVFFYRLPRDGTEVCVDTRTYGNDARFVRRSCKPNAEVKHCIEKGTLHLYIVTTTAIEKNAEITIRHEQHHLMLSPNPNSPITTPIICACNNTRECQVAAVGQINRRGSNGALAENADGRERRRRGRRNTVCEDSDSLSAVSSTSINQTTTTPAPTPPAAPPRRTITTTNTSSAPVTRQIAKEDPATVQPPLTSPSNIVPQVQETNKKDKKKMTREERKMEAIMKAFERMEKAEQRKQEVQARNAQRKESGGTHSDNEDTHVTSAQMKSKSQNLERPVRRKRRKGRARTTSSSHSQQSRCRTRLNSADSDISSGEESNSMQSPPLPNQSCPTVHHRLPYASHLHTPTKDVTDNSGSSATGHHGIPTAAGLLLALANSNVPGPSSPPLQQPAPIKSPTCDSGASSSSQSSTPSTPLSSACLLVAAAVGPLAPGFKFPKTKKVLMNEWLKESPDPPQTHVPQISPIPAMPQAQLNSGLNKSTDFLSPTDPSPEFLTQSYAAKSLATLVQAANSVSGICHSPPQRRQTIPGNSTSSCSGSTGSAKKRWLRQAISEECDSPNSRPESPPSEMVAPPKKRRIARESLSSDNYTPPTTPTLLNSEQPQLSLPTGHNEDEFVDLPQSPINEQSTPNTEYGQDTVKDDVDSESEVADMPEEKEKPKFIISKTDIPESLLCVKYEEKDEPMPLMNNGSILPVKLEANILTKEEKPLKSSPLSSPCKIEPTVVKNEACKALTTDDIQTVGIKNEKIEVQQESYIVKKEATPVKKAAQTVFIEKGTVEIIDQNEPDTEMEDLSSPIAAMESEAVLKQRAAEMRLEFSGSIAEMVHIASDNDKSENDRKLDNNQTDDNMSIDEFDVEAQMMKITGDDGNDYKEKVDTSSEKDKSMDGIEGLMDSSKEDSDSDDKDLDDLKEESDSFREFHINSEQRAFREFETKPEDRGFIDFEVKETKNLAAFQPPKLQPSNEAIISSEESILESTSSNVDVESMPEAPKIEFSIPPLSERIRKKPDQSQAPKLQLDFEASIIESTIEIEAGDSATQDEQKSMLSSALRELLEAKIDVDDESEGMHVNNDNANIAFQEEDPLDRIPCTNPVNTEDLVIKNEEQSIQSENINIRVEDAVPKEPKRLKDPRTITPTEMPAPPTLKPEVPAPVKRKLSISEYRKRKQQSSGTPPEPEPEPSGDTSSERGGARGRSDSASSGTSSLSSDEEGNSKVSLDLPGLTTLPLFVNVDSDEKKGGEEGVMGWSAAPTLVERQRENLTERLKREFGLFLSDDEEERARKQGLSAEAILKARKLSPSSQTPFSMLMAGFPPAQLPPQPYIPPPGSAPIHFPQFQSKIVPVAYPNFAIPQAVSQQPLYQNNSTTAQPLANKQQTQQFLIPQAPPGSNPYPPQFVPSSSVPTVQRFPATPPPPPPLPPPPQPNAQFFQPPQQAQKNFFNHPAPRT